MTDFPNPKWLVAGKQVICKEDFIGLEDAILTQGLVRMQPCLTWVNVTTVKVEATADCHAAMQFTGMPNVINPAVQVSGELSDKKVRTVTADVTMDIASTDLYGTEKASQWYAVLAIAADEDDDFSLKSMPFCRVKSQAGQVIKTGTLLVPATGINYGFTANEFTDGMIYFLTGASRGLMRPITLNGVDTDTTITYSGTGLSVAAGDWFMILPPTNFRLVGAIFNNSGSNIVEFEQVGNQVRWLAPPVVKAPVGTYTILPAHYDYTITEDISCSPPTAISWGVQGWPTQQMGHPDGELLWTLSDPTSGTNIIGLGATATADCAPDSMIRTFAEIPIKNCKYIGFPGDSTLIPTYSNKPIVIIYFKYPPGCGY